MKEKLKYLTSRKSFHVCMIIIIIAIILFVVGILVLRYQVEGETNMPFDITKVILISSSEGIDKSDNTAGTWAFDINQNNDIYIYIEKNSNYKEEAVIQSILIDQIKVEKQKEIGSTHFYRPNIDEAGGTFSNTAENEIQSIEYQGSLESDIKNLKIGNQGGIVVFRCANNNVAEYVSDVSTSSEITSNQLLKNANVNEEDLKSKITFDLTIRTEDGKEYKTTLSYDIPVEGIVENGTTSREITDFSDVIFKRTKN